MQAEVAALVIHVAGKLAEPTAAKARPKKQTHSRDEQSDDKQYSANVWHIKTFVGADVKRL